MLTGLFRQKHITGLVLWLILALGLWRPGFRPSISIDGKNLMPLMEGLSHFFNNYPEFQIPVTLTILLATALLLNYWVDVNGLLEEKSWLPALGYLLTMSSASCQISPHPLVFANFFLALALIRLTQSYRKEEGIAVVFDTGFLVALSTLFYFPAWLLFPIIWVGLIVLRPFVWREWTSSLIGLLTPFAFTFTWYYWNDNMGSLIFEKIFFPTQDFVFDLASQKPEFIRIMAALLIIVFLSYLKVLAKNWPVNTILAKNLIVVLSWMSLLGATAFILAPVFRFEYLGLAAIPASIFIANYFNEIKMWWWADLLLLIWVVFALQATA
jgi:hypothetical protein